MTARGRRALLLAVVLVVLGLVVVSAAVSRRWVTVVPVDPEIPGGGTVAVMGSSLAPALVPLALMGVAGLVAAAAAGRMARGTLRLAASVLVTLAGAGIVVVGLGAAGDLAGAARGVEAVRQAGATVVRDASVLRYAALPGGLSVAAAGVVALAAGGSWPGLAPRYDRDRAPVATSGAPAPVPVAESAASTTSMNTWDALERGDDPTR